MRIVEDGVTVDLAPLSFSRINGPEPGSSPRIPPPTLVRSPSIRSAQSISSLYGGKTKWEFPRFIVTISVIQVVLLISVGENSLLLLFGYDPYRRHELWRLVSVVLAHSDQFHLWLNVGMQLILGISLELDYPSKKVGLLYFASSLGGSLAGSVVYPQRYSRGASGAVFGLLFAHFAATAMNWKDLNFKKCRIFCLSFCVVLELGVSILDELLNTYRNTGVGIHIGGAVTGLLVSFLVMTNKDSSLNTKKFLFSAVILVTLSMIIAVVNIAFPSYYLPTEWNFDYETSFSKYLWKLISIDLPQDSFERKSCEGDPDCKTRLEIFLHKWYYSNG